MFLPEKLEEMEKYNPELVKAIRSSQLRENMLLLAMAIVVIIIVLIVVFPRFTQRQTILWDQGIYDEHSDRLG